jgi:hypothetical protein
MNADIKGALEQINKSYKAFEHNGKSLTKGQVKAVLEYGLSKGYEKTNQLSDEEVDKVLSDYLGLLKKELTELAIKEGYDTIRF